MANETPRKQTEQAQAGDREALSRLVENLRGPLFAVAYRELRHYDNAHDAVANALIRIVRHLPRLRDPGQIQAWASRIVRNEARRLLWSPDATLPEDAADDANLSLLRLDIERELRHVPRDQARACALFYFEGRSVAEIAQRLARPEGTIKYYLHRTRARLRDSLGKDYAMTSDTLPVFTAVIAGDDFAPLTAGQIEAALHRAGWRTVHHIAEAPRLTARSPQLPDHLMPPLSDAQLIVLGEQAGGRSAFELSASWRASHEGKRLTLLLLIDGSRPQAETESSVMAAYVAGFDFLFTRPADVADVESAARKTRERLESGG